MFYSNWTVYSKQISHWKFIDYVHTTYDLLSNLRLSVKCHMAKATMAHLGFEKEIMRTANYIKHATRQLWHIYLQIQKLETWKWPLFYGTNADHEYIPTSQRSSLMVEPAIHRHLQIVNSQVYMSCQHDGQFIKLFYAPVVRRTVSMSWRWH